MARFRELLAMFAIGSVTGFGTFVLLNTPESAADSTLPLETPPPAIVVTSPSTTGVGAETVELPPATTRTLLRWGALEATTRDELLGDLPPEIVNVITASRTAVPVLEDQ